MTDKELALAILDAPGEIKVSIGKDGCFLTLKGEQQRITDDQAEIALWTIQQRMGAGC